MASLLRELLVDEAQYVEILCVFNDKICVPTYRNASDFGLQTKTSSLLSAFDRLKSLHISFLNDLRSIKNDGTDTAASVNSLFARYSSEFSKTDLELTEGIYDGMKALFEMSSHQKIMNSVRKLNFESSFNDIEPQEDNNGTRISRTTKSGDRRSQSASLLVYYKEEPQFIAYILYLGQRIHRYMSYYEIECLVSNQKMYQKCMELNKEIDSALYLLCLESQISQCQIKIFMKVYVVWRDSH